jgi:hypothetical protein
MKEKSGVIHVIEQPNALNDVHIYSAFKAFTRSCTGVKMLARLPQNQQSGGSSSGWFGRTTTTDQNVNTLKDEEEGESRLQFFFLSFFSTSRINSFKDSSVPSSSSSTSAF